MNNLAYQGLLFSDEGLDTTDSCLDSLLHYVLTDYSELNNNYALNDIMAVTTSTEPVAEDTNKKPVKAKGRGRRGRPRTRIDANIIQERRNVSMNTKASDHKLKQVPHINFFRLQMQGRGGECRLKYLLVLKT